MLVTVQSRILDAIAARLALMSVANGYLRSVQKIERATLTPFKTDDLPACNYWPGVDVQTGKGAGWVDRELTVVIEYYTRTRDLPFTDVAFELALDVGMALLRAPSAPLPDDNPDMTLGSLVRSMQLQTITPQIGEGQTPWCGAAMSYSIGYRVAANDPSLLIP